MKPYSLDLRQRVVEAYENGEGTHEELAEAFCVSLSCDGPRLADSERGRNNALERSS